MTFEASFVQKQSLGAQLDARMLLFDGSYLAALKAARLYRDFVDTGVAVTEQEIKNNVTKAYMNVLILDINKETIDNNISSLEKSLFEMREMYKEGFIEELDVDRLELSLSNLQTEMSKLLQVENLSKNLLKFQMDYPLDDQIELTEDLDSFIAKSKIDQVNLDDDMDLDNRPEILQIKKGIELQDINTESISKSNWPSLSAFANASETLARDDLFNSDLVGWLPSAVLGLNLDIPIYDGGLRKAQIEKSEVSNARLQYRNAKATVESRERSLQLAEKIFEKTQIKFKEGVGSSIELTQAESALFNEQSNYINALYDLLSAKVDLDIALGNL